MLRGKSNIKSLFDPAKLNGVVPKTSDANFIRRAPLQPAAASSQQEEEPLQQDEESVQEEPLQQDEESVQEEPLQQDEESVQEEPPQVVPEEEEYSIMERRSGGPLNRPVSSASELSESAESERESESSENQGPVAPMDEDRIRAGMRRMDEIDMTPAEWEKYARIRGGDLLAPAQAANVVKRRYHRPERFEGPMEHPSDASLVGTAELAPHVKNRSRAFRPQDGKRSYFERALSVARKAQKRLQRPRYDGESFADAQRDAEDRSAAMSENWFGSDRADKENLVPGFRAKGSTERPYLTELIPQQFTYKRHDKDQALPVGPVRELNDQEQAHRIRKGQRNRQDDGLEVDFEADRERLEEQVRASEAAHTEASNRGLGVGWNPLSWIAGIKRAWTRRKDRKRTARELSGAQQALQDRIAQFSGNKADVDAQRQIENEQIRQQGAPLLARRRELAQASEGREADPNFELNPREVEVTPPARDDSAASEVRKNVVDPFAEAVKRQHVRARLHRMDQKREGFSVPNYAESLLALPEPDRDPRYMGIAESKANGQGSYEAKIAAHAQRRMLKDVFKENPIKAIDSQAEAKPKLIDAGKQREFLGDALGRRAEALPEPQNPAQEAARLRYDKYKDDLSSKMDAYLNDRMDTYRPIKEDADKKRAEEKQQKKWWREHELYKQQEAEAADRRDAEREAKGLIGASMEDDSSGEEADSFQRPEEDHGQGGEMSMPGGNGQDGLLDEQSRDVVRAQELQDQARASRKIDAPLVANYFENFSKQDHDNEERRKRREEGEQAVQGAGPMVNVLNPIVEAGVKHQFEAGQGYVRQNYDESEHEERQKAYVKPGANEVNLRKNYIQEDRFAENQFLDNLAPGVNSVDRAQALYQDYSAYRDLYKSHEKSSKAKSAWQDSNQGKIERYKLTNNDPLKQFKMPGTGKAIKHGYRFMEFNKKKK
ncbi:MAG: hypothetical protein ACOYLU_02720 [Limisphaerales bacterium]